MPSCLYFDEAASTPLDPIVYEAMQPWLMPAGAGNASALTHDFGISAAEAVDKSRHQVAIAMGGTAEDVIFTSGATEANNLAILGLASYLRSINRTHIVTSAVEHKSVLEPLTYLTAQGFDVTVVPVKSCGEVRLDQLSASLRPDTGLISLQAVNNETGVVQPFQKAAAIARENKIFFHVDAVQALGKIPFSLAVCPADCITLSAHKIYGPQGIGALYACSEVRACLQPLTYGGHQENGLRPGTLPVALCVGFGEACVRLSGEQERQRVLSLRRRLLTPLEKAFPDMEIYGQLADGWQAPGIVNMRFPGVDSDALIMLLPELALSAGAACSMHAPTRLSHVILAMTGSDVAARECIRLSFGRFTTEAHIDSAAQHIQRAVTALYHDIIPSQREKSHENCMCR